MNSSFYFHYFDMGFRILNNSTLTYVINIINFQLQSLSIVWHYFCILLQAQAMAGKGSLLKTKVDEVKALERDVQEEERHLILMTNIRNLNNNKTATSKK